MDWLFDLFKPRVYRMRKRLDRLREKLDLVQAKTDDAREMKNEIYGIMDEVEGKISQLEEGMIKDYERKYVEKEIADSLKRIEADMRKLK